MKWGISILILSLLLISCSGSKLPKIQDPEALRKDCAILYQEFPETIKTNIPVGTPAYLRIIPKSIPEEKWTPAILALKPVKVFRCTFGISIWIGGNANENVGYYVFCDPYLGPSDTPNGMGESSEAGMAFIKTNMKGIYEFPTPQPVI
jgi:hypothetical protein